MTALAVVALAVPTAAFASSPSGTQYKSTSHQVAANVASGGDGPGTTSNSSSPSAGSGASGTVAGLPFTGLDMGVLAVAAAALFGAGLALRRLSDPGRRSVS